MPAPFRRLENTFAHSERAATSETRGSRSTSRVSTRISARLHDCGVDAKPVLVVSSPKRIRSKGISTFPPVMPNCTNRPSRRRLLRAASIPPEEPEVSIATSASLRLDGIVVVLNPSSCANLRRSTSFVSPRIVTSPPRARATCAASWPIGPGPTTTTWSPELTALGLRRPWQMQASGSMRVAAALGCGRDSPSQSASVQPNIGAAARRLVNRAPLVRSDVWLTPLELPHVLKLGTLEYRTRDYVVLRLTDSAGNTGTAAGYTRYTPLIVTIQFLLQQMDPRDPAPQAVSDAFRRQFIPGWAAMVRGASLIDLALWDLRSRPEKFNAPRDPRV